ncbi:MAG: sarcosine oxidase subunit delta [Azospirillaceae bacterium]|nr:sarcosine oxidase subunit delta [Azospirillaceae bacterium]
MRIPCPHCGDRSHDEFSYGGAADRRRPTTADFGPEWLDYVYLRDNPAGLHRELWYHGSGCRCWLIVERNTLSHAITAVHAVLPASSPAMEDA